MRTGRGLETDKSISEICGSRLLPVAIGDVAAVCTLEAHEVQGLAEALRGDSVGKVAQHEGCEMRRQSRAAGAHGLRVSLGVLFGMLAAKPLYGMLLGSSPQTLHVLRLRRAPDASLVDRCDCKLRHSLRLTLRRTLDHAPSRIQLESMRHLLKEAACEICPLFEFLQVAMLLLGRDNWPWAGWGAGAAHPLCLLEALSNLNEAEP